ncbi:MAG: zf-HC2 domain-containing protein [Chitinispirillia bacterium]|nr:zf-HC2 domain-containing protein [Chitinispirillia bacterium]
MACSKFEVSGLLYISGELDAGEAAAYEAHLEECEECRRETGAYKQEHVSLYTAEILGDNPSEAVDSEILRVCANPKKMLAPSAITPMIFIKKYTPVTLFLMLIMVAVGGYVTYHSMSADDLAKKAAAAAELAAVAQPVSPEQGAGGELVLADSSNDSSRLNKPRGNLNMEGVVTVSGKEQMGVIRDSGQVKNTGKSK